MFLDELKRELNNCEVDDIDEVIAYFDEMIEDRKENGMDEEMIISHLDSPKEIALVLKGKEYKEEKHDEEIYDDDDKQVYSTDGKDIIMVKISLNADDITVKRGDDERLYFIYDRKKDGRYSIVNKGDELKITDNGPKFIFFSKGESNEVELILPRTYKGEMKVEALSGDIKISDLEGSFVKVETLSGDIDLEESTIRSLKVQSTSGEISITDTRGQEIKVESVSGDIELNDLTYDFIKVENVSGNSSIDILGNEEDYAVYYDHLFENYKLRQSLKDTRRLKMEAVTGQIEYHFHN